MEPQCLQNLFIVFDTDAALEYHTDKVHRKNSKYRGGKAQYDATGLLGVRIDEDDEEEEEDEDGEGPEEIVVIPGFGTMNADAVRMVVQELENRGEEVPEQIYEALAETRFKESNKESKQKKTKIEIKDTVGKNFTRIVKLS